MKRLIPEGEEVNLNVPQLGVEECLGYEAGDIEAGRHGEEAGEGPQPGGGGQQGGQVQVGGQFLGVPKLITYILYFTLVEKKFEYNGALPCPPVLGQVVHPGQTQHHLGPPVSAGEGAHSQVCRVCFKLGTSI